MPILGCIADDSIGASEVAALFAAGGLRTQLYANWPVNTDTELDAIVLPLDIRGKAPSVAVEAAQAALMWLQSQGCTHFYIKYDDRFTCTRTGNIGPVCDDAMRILDVPYTILCPGRPDQGVKVNCGKLYIGDEPAREEDGAAWSNDILTVMRTQSKYPCIKISRNICHGRSQVLSTLADFSFDRHCEHFYAIPDFNDECNADKILDLFGNLKLITGGSGLAQSWAKRLAAGHV